MGFKQSLNREMKKLGYIPIKDRAFRYPKIDSFCRAWTNGVTDIGLWSCTDGRQVSRKRVDKLPLANRSVFYAVWTEPQDVKDYARTLVESATIGARGSAPIEAP